MGAQHLKACSLTHPPHRLTYKVQFVPEHLYPAGPWGELYQSTTPVANGTLMTWHTGTVPPGAYWLPLLVPRHDGNYPPPCELRLVVTR